MVIKGSKFIENSAGVSHALCTVLFFKNLHFELSPDTDVCIVSLLYF